MLDQKTVNVDGDDYLLTMFPTTIGLEYQKKIAKLVGPVMAEVMKGGEGEGVNPIGLAIGKFSESLDLLDVSFIKELVIKGATKANGSAIVFDMEFAGKYVKLYKLALEVVKYNFEDVFTLVGSNLQ